MTSSLSYIRTAVDFVFLQKANGFMVYLVSIIIIIIVNSTEWHAIDPIEFLLTRRSLMFLTFNFLQLERN
jgi:hypothetical protein